MNIEPDIIYRVNKTLLEMFKDRNMNVKNNILEEGLSLNDFLLLVGQRTDLTQFDFQINDKNVYLRYIESKKKKTIISDNDIINLKRKLDNPSVIVIFNDNISKNLSSKISDTEIFHYKRLLFNPSKHYLVPKHEIINKKDCPYDIDKLPIIDVNEPMARYLNMKINDICKITRTNTNCGTSIYYRLCKKIYHSTE